MLNKRISLYYWVYYTQCAHYVRYDPSFILYPIPNQTARKYKRFQKDPPCIIIGGMIYSRMWLFVKHADKPDFHP